jgi:hypothetical protein
MIDSLPQSRFNLNEPAVICFSIAQIGAVARRSFLGDARGILWKTLAEPASLYLRKTGNLAQRAYGKSPVRVVSHTTLGFERVAVGKRLE